MEKTAKQLAEELKQQGFNISHLFLDEEKIKNLKDLLRKEMTEYDSYKNTYQNRCSLQKYNLNHLYLVRRADIFSTNNILTVPKAGEVLTYFNKEFFGFHSFEKTPDITFPRLRDFRSTKHFTLNNLVSTNNGGSWEGLPYIYLEPLKPHLQNKNLRNLSKDDTYFQSDIKLTKPTLIIKQKDLEQLLNQNDTEITETLKNTEIIVLDNDSAKSETDIHNYVDYVLTFIKHSFATQTYSCISQLEKIDGPFSQLNSFAKENNITYEDSHYGSASDTQDNLHRLRNAVEDIYNYITYILANHNITLTQEQREIFENATHSFEESCIEAPNHNIVLDFTAENTPEYRSDLFWTLDNKKRKLFEETTFAKTKHFLQCSFDELIKTFKDTKFYETIDHKIINEETEKYNQAFDEAIKSGAEFNRVKTFKPIQEEETNE